MLQPSTTATTTAPWPIPGDAPDLLATVEAQAKVVADQEALLHAYQGVLNTAQTAPTTAVGTATGTSLALSSVVGVILLGSTVTGTNIPAGTTIVGGPLGGGAGTYTTNQATTANNNALTFTPGGGATSTWPTPQDADTLNLIVQALTAVIRNQTALLQQYQDLLNISETPPPQTGP
jgi:hypothetical protein